MGKSRKRIGIRTLKNEASRVVNEVRERQAEYVVTKRGEPVAVLRPITPADTDLDHAAYVAEIMASTRETARRIGKLSSGESVVSAVSRQRR